MRAAQHAGPQQLRNWTWISGGSTFAEDPNRAAPEARIIWRAALDPGTLSIVAAQGNAGDPDSIEVETLAPWLSIARGPHGGEHVVLSDGYRHIRLDVAEGSLAGNDPVRLHYHLSGRAAVEPQVLPLRRLLHLCRRRRFARSLFPPDPWIGRWLTALRVHDGLAAGASQREIAAVLFGADRVADDWTGHSDSLRSRIRRLVRHARTMVGGGYRSLLGGSARAVDRDGGRTAAERRAAASGERG